MDITFINEHPNQIFDQEEVFEQKILNLFKEEGFKKDLFLNVVFLNDEGLLAINREYLNHDYYTDIITFPIEETDEHLEADVYVSLDRVADNAIGFSQDYKDELLRVVLHGALHLCGYKDKSKAEEALMRSKEDFYMKR